jgi:hypothetical protein
LTKYPFQELVGPTSLDDRYWLPTLAFPIPANVLAIETAITEAFTQFGDHPVNLLICSICWLRANS